ncbi:cell division protein FtsQ [Amphibacillus marinus]|uniref:Cell division protein DivIB n=1 Tax=Amphibacillus marinus TaxID=872970 RepID=A0A1H8I555_9BACI|nr:FtsQ-type POTRA domain-containing protein [Amphibacillus marinus]SEN63186.1 cell division protein FtsQ [Amphibacillus marinus]
MDSQKVVSIEDRIPKLKQARRKKTNRRLVFYVCLFFVLISIVVYLQSPLSFINEINVSGQHYIDEEEIIAYSELSSEVNVWGVRISEIESNILRHDEIKSVSVVRQLPNNFKIEVEELDKVAYLSEGEFFYPLLENGRLLDSFRIIDWQGDAPLLFGFSEDSALELLTEQLTKSPEFINNHISEIHLTPTDSNPLKLRLFMTDGFEVETSIRNFSQNLSSYPSIVSQLDPSNKGVIQIGEGGAVFNSFQDLDQQKNNEDEQENETEG